MSWERIQKNLFPRVGHVLLFFMSWLFAAHMAAAQATLPPPLSKVTDVSAFTSWLLGVLLTILWPAVVVMLAYVGYLFVAAQGNSEGLERAKRALTWALVGTAIVAGAQILKTIIENTVRSLS